MIQQWKTSVFADVWKIFSQLFDSGLICNGIDRATVHINFRSDIFEIINRRRRRVVYLHVFIEIVILPEESTLAALNVVNQLFGTDLMSHVCEKCRQQGNVTSEFIYVLFQ